MTRWAKTCVLVGRGEPVQADDGSWSAGEETETEVFCNPYTVGLEEWAVSNRDLGLRADAEIQLRTCDYSGETIVRYNDELYTVERSTVSGDFTKLQLGRRTPNVEEQ